MHAYRNSLIYLSASIALTSCVGFSTTRPTILGSIRDTDTREPLAKVYVAIQGDDYRTQSSSDGSFHIPEKRSWRFYPMIFPADYFPGYTLITSKSGYTDTRTQLAGLEPHEDIDIEMIRMRP